MSEEKKILDVFALDKGKRILVWICEAVITFFFAFILMHAAVTPLYSAVSGYSKVASDGALAVKQRNESLKNEGLIYFENEETQLTDITYGLPYTYELFMSDYIKQDSLMEHEVFKKYYEKYDSLENYYNDF